MNSDTIMEIDLKKLKNNTTALCKCYNDYKYKIANLKNNAHGMGFDIVNTLINNGINYLLVGSFKDALNIRKLNSSVPIIVNYPVELNEIYDCINNNITITIDNIPYLKKIAALDLKDNLKIHILIDNGSNKIGLQNKKELDESIEIIESNKHLELEGIYTEITSLGIEDNYYYKEVNKFYKIIEESINENLIIHLNEPLMYHNKLDNINGIRFDLSLIGIEENINDTFFTKMHIKKIEKEYGDLAFPNVNLELIFSITSLVTSVRKVIKNELVGRNYIAKEDGYVAVIPVGHKDGITKAFNYVGINNFRRHILTDEIDYIIVEADENVGVYDKVYIVNEERGIYDFINLLKTNRYYLMSVLNKDLQKKYINQDETEGQNYL